MWSRRHRASASACTTRTTTRHGREFTEPEILRTNLASVILQMTALGLGDVAEFPFLDPPDGRAVRDGVALLEELGALATATSRPIAARLTPLGRRLAQLADRSAARSHGARSRTSRLRARGDGHRRRAVDPGPSRAPDRQAAGGRRIAPPLRRGRVRLPLARQAVGPPPRAAAGAVVEPVPQAVPHRVPQLPACARVAGPVQPAAPRRTASLGHAPAAPRPGIPIGSTRRCWPASCRTSGCATATRASYRGARGSKFMIGRASAVAKSAASG